MSGWTWMFIFLEIRSLATSCSYSPEECAKVMLVLQLLMVVAVRMVIMIMIMMVMMKKLC